MKFIILSQNGASRAVQLSSRRVAVLASLTVFACALLAGAAYWHGGQQDFEDGLIAEWRQDLAGQERMLADLRARSAAESAALGRQLAQLQARIMRMEALGQRVVDVAELDDGEFAFADPAALGGPATDNAQSLALTELQLAFDNLDSRIRSRENELIILEGLLSDEEHREAAALGGRPVTWGWMSSPYGYRVDPITGKRAWHAGVDFAGKADSPVIAVASGVVTFAGERIGFGNTVEISHGRGLVTRYGHHKSLTVKAGDIVKKGQQIGVMGSTGRSTGPHVHFEVEHLGRTVNPSKYL